MYLANFSKITRFHEIFMNQRPQHFRTEISILHKQFLCASPEWCKIDREWSQEIADREILDLFWNIWNELIATQCVQEHLSLAKISHGDISRFHTITALNNIHTCGNIRCGPRISVTWIRFVCHCRRFRVVIVSKSHFFAEHIEMSENTQRGLSGGRTPCTDIYPQDCGRK